MSQQDIVFTIILLLSFLLFIIPSTASSQKLLDEFQKKQKEDLEKWKKRQYKLEIQARHERLNH